MVLMAKIKKLVETLKVIKTYIETGEPQTFEQAKAQLGLIKLMCGEAIIAAEVA